MRGWNTSHCGSDGRQIDELGCALLRPDEQPDSIAISTNSKMIQVMPVFHASAVHCLNTSARNAPTHADTLSRVANVATFDSSRSTRSCMGEK